MDNHSLRNICVTATTALLSLLCGCGHSESSSEALKMMDRAYKARNYSRLMLLADSLEHEGDLLPSTANYWRGYASDRMKKKADAAAYWQKSITAAEASDAPENLDSYVKSASRLANQMCLSGDYEGTLQMAQPVVERLERLGVDDGTDYINLLIYIGLCQVTTGHSEEETHQGFVRACEKHRQHIDSIHSDDAYKDAIAGLVNIAYYCVQAGKYEPALYYTRHFGELLIEYEQRPGVDSAYIDRQVGRFTIYKSVALSNLGRRAEADATYKAFLDTKFSQTDEGRRLAEGFVHN